MAVTSAWGDYPGYRIELLPLAGVGRVHAGTALLAESSSCLILRESDHPDQLYFPIGDVLAELVPSEHHTVCPFKGQADYWSVAGPDGPVADIVWGYPTPFAEVAGIAGYVAFYPDRLTVTAAVPFGDGDEAVAAFPVWGTAADLIGLMNVTPEGPANGDIVRYRTPIYPDPPLGTFFDWARKQRSRNVVEGGQQLGAVIAAAGEARPDLRVTWASIIFAKAAHWDSALDVELALRHGGRSIAAFDARVVQDGVLRSTASVLGDVGAADVLRHAVAPPAVAGPADCPRYDFGVIGREYRVVDDAYERQDMKGPPVLYVWSRFARDPGSRALHQAAHAQSSTHWSIAAAMRPDPTVTEAAAHLSLSTGVMAVTIAFHDDLDVTRWLLTEVSAIYAGGGSCQTQTRTFDPDGRLVASSTVQAMVRPFARPPREMGQDASTAM